MTDPGPHGPGQVEPTRAVHPPVRGVYRGLDDLPPTPPVGTEARLKVDCTLWRYTGNGPERGWLFVDEGIPPVPGPPPAIPDLTATLYSIAGSEGLYPVNAQQIAVVCAALTAFDTYRDPAGNCSPLQLAACEHGLAVWRHYRDTPDPDDDLGVDLLGLISGVDGDLGWAFLPVAALPYEVAETARATWLDPGPPRAITDPDLGQGVICSACKSTPTVPAGHVGQPVFECPNHGPLGPISR